MSFSLTTLKTEQHADLTQGLGHAESLLHVKRWISTPGVAGTVVATTLGQLLPEEDKFLRFSWRDAAQRVADFLRGERTEVIGEERTWIPIQMLSLYRPSVDGAKATISMSTSSEQSASIALEVFGTGGGPEFTVELAWNDKLESEHESLIVNYSRLARCNICRVHTRAGSTGEFVRLAELLPDEKLEVRSLPKDHVSMIKDASVPVTIDLRGQRGNLTRKLTTKSGVQWKGKLGLKIEAFGIESSIEYLITRSTETEYEYLLPGGYLYQVLQGSSPPDWWWNVPVDDASAK